MTLRGKLRTAPALKWVAYVFSESHCRLSKPPSLEGITSHHIVQRPRCYGTKSFITEKCRKVVEGSTINPRRPLKIPRTSQTEAQASLLEYLHLTRGLNFMDAEYISLHSPRFLERLIQNVKGPENRKPIARFLLYHPINEFEPFFESLGLKPSDYLPLLPCNLMFLSDDNLLLENYHTLCHYGIARNKIGKIFKEAPEVFRFKYGVLQSKLQAYEESGVSKLILPKIVACCPYVLVEDVYKEIVQVLEILKNLGFELNWIEKHLSEKSSYNWRQMIELFCYFDKIGFSDKQLRELISHHPDLILDGSQSISFSIVVFLFKFGLSMENIFSLFLQFPQVQAGKFVSNLRYAFLFLTEMEMEVEDIGRLIRCHSLLLGSCSLKNPKSLLTQLNTGKKRICVIIKENPEELQKWTLGSKVKPLPSSGEDLKSEIHRLNFLLELGFVENSDELKKALKVFRGKGWELQERFDCLVKAGLDHKDVARMIKSCPQVLNQSKEAIEAKVDFLINGLGYPVSSLLSFPSFVNYTSKRAKLRYTMYEWLRDQGKADPLLALSTIIATSEELFMRAYVSQHPNGPQVWEELKKQIYSD